ncbi:MAG: NUDIX hydrolase [Spirochaetes bacterium]|nr:MAG: NUDIX hydrolase [Spirochaetota bacterium]
MILGKSKRPRIRVAGIVIESGRVLLIAHQKAGKVYWLLPGGGVEYTESLPDALAREFREELQLDVQPGDIAFVSDSINPASGRHVVNICFHCGKAGGRITLGKDRRLHSYGFFTAEQVSHLTIFPPVNDELVAALGRSSHGRVYLGARWMDL